MSTFYPSNDRELARWLGNFIAVAGANLSVLGMTASDLSALQTLKADLDNGMIAAEDAKRAAREAFSAKERIRDDARRAIGARGKMIGANPHIPDDLKMRLGLTVSEKSRTAVVPITPTDLVVTPLAGGGVNRLTWSRSGNRPATQFVIEMRGDAASDAWTFVDFTARLSYEHANRTPGQRVCYRVKAKRGDQESATSEVVVANA